MECVWCERSVWDVWRVFDMSGVCEAVVCSVSSGMRLVKGGRWNECEVVVWRLWRVCVTCGKEGMWVVCDVDKVCLHWNLLKLRALVCAWRTHMSWEGDMYVRYWGLCVRRVCFEEVCELSVFWGSVRGVWSEWVGIYVGCGWVF